MLINTYPDRLTITTPKNNGWYKAWSTKLDRELGIEKPLNLSNLKVKKSSLQLSKSSIRELRNSVNSLVLLSPKRTVKRDNGKFIYNYRASFVTLTLPSTQLVSDIDLKKCLNLFLTDLRRVYGVQNYVWRSELQKNGNIHFHIVLDKYIEYSPLRNYWLKALRHTTQVQRYQAKFMNMNYLQYHLSRLNRLLEKGYSKAECSTITKKNFANGKINKWLLPPCINVKSIYNVNQMSAYVAKYICKSDSNDTSSASDENAILRASSFGKIWSRSTSLSRLKYKYPVVKNDIIEFFNDMYLHSSTIVKVYDYATCIYFNLKLLPLKLKNRIVNNITNVAISSNYTFCET